jgi:hypothetical protein
MVIDILNASLTKGTKNAFMPRANPSTANIEPISIIGTIRVFLLSVMSGKIYFISNVYNIKASGIRRQE